MSSIRIAGSIISIIGGVSFLIMNYANYPLALYSGNSGDLIGWLIILCSGILGVIGGILAFRKVTISGLLVVAGALIIIFASLILEGNNIIDYFIICEYSLIGFLAQMSLTTWFCATISLETILMIVGAIMLIITRDED